MLHYIEVLLQTLLAFTAIMIYARLLGKQQIGQLTFFEYVNGITLGSIAAVMCSDVEPEHTGLHFFALTIFAALTYLMGFLSIRSRPVRKLVTGEATIVVHNGKILEDNMRKMNYNLDELSMQLREQNIFKIEDVEYAILEPDGHLSVLPKSQKRPLTPADLNIATRYEGLSSELVVDGEIVFQNLQQNNLTVDWLRDQISSRGVTDLKQIAYAAINTDGSLYLDVKKDDLQNPVDITDLPEPPVIPPQKK